VALADSRCFHFNGTAHDCILKPAKILRKRYAGWFCKRLIHSFPPGKLLLIKLILLAASLRIKSLDWVEE
jgi:hypothetical protein